MSESGDSDDIDVIEVNDRDTREADVAADSEEETQEDVDTSKCRECGSYYVQAWNSAVGVKNYHCNKCDNSWTVKNGEIVDEDGGDESEEVDGSVEMDDGDMFAAVEEELGAEIEETETGEDIEDAGFADSTGDKYDTDDPESVIEHVIDNVQGMMSNSVRRDFQRAVRDASDDVIDEYFESIEDRLEIGVTLREFRRIAEQVELDFSLCECMPNACNLHGSLVRVEMSEMRELVTEELLNFELRMDEKIRLPEEDGVTAEFVIDKPGKPELTVEADPGITGDKRQFKEHITSSYFDTVFEREGQDVMRDINKFFGSIDMPVKDAVEKIGVHDGKYVLPGGVVSENGWVDDPEHVIIPVDGETALHREFVGVGEEIGDDEVREILELLLNIRGHERLTPVLSWFFATSHASVIRDKYGMFNHLNIVGESGCGKTRTTRLLMDMLGFDLDGFEVEDMTNYAMDNKLHGVQDGCVWYDEYIPSEIHHKDIDRFHGKYKGAANGETSARGNWEDDTDTWDIACPLVVTGESEISKNAQARRSINVRFGKSTTMQSETVEPFKKLRGIDFGTGFNLSGFAEHFYQFALQKRSDDILDEFDTARKEINEIIEDWNIELGDDEIRGLAIVKWGWKLLCEFAADYGVDADELPDEDDVEAAIRHCAGVDENGKGGGRVTEEDEFMRLFSRAAAADDYLEYNTDYTVVKGDSVGCELRIKTERCYDKISKYVQDHGTTSGLLDSGREYKSRFSQLAGEEGNYIDGVGVNSPPINRCTSINVCDAVQSIPGFSTVEIDGVEFRFIDYLEEDEEDGDGDDDGDSEDVGNPDGDSDSVSVSKDEAGMQRFCVKFFERRGSHHVSKSALKKKAHEQEGFGFSLAQELIEELIDDGVLLKNDSGKVALADGVER